MSFVLKLLALPEIYVTDIKSPETIVIWHLGFRKIKASSGETISHIQIERQSEGTFYLFFQHLPQRVKFNIQIIIRPLLNSGSFSIFFIYEYNITDGLVIFISSYRILNDN